MKKLQLMAAACVLFGMGLVGCQKTAEGVAEDTNTNVKKVDQATQKAVEATKEAAKNSSAAVSLTPKVKDAITADATLNNPNNHIDVDSKDNVVHLKGHVQSETAKKRAEEVAKKALKDAGATDTLSNELTIQKP